MKILKKLTIYIIKKMIFIMIIIKIYHKMDFIQYIKVIK
jgi:hypothetical protein